MLKLFTYSIVVITIGLVCVKWNGNNKDVFRSLKTIAKSQSLRIQEGWKTITKVFAPVAMVKKWMRL